MEQGSFHSPFTIHYSPPSAFCVRCRSWRRRRGGRGRGGERARRRVEKFRVRGMEGGGGGGGGGGVGGGCRFFYLFGLEQARGVEDGAHAAPDGGDAEDCGGRVR